MQIFNTLKLLLPALIPSWNFFDIITASPRIQYTLLPDENETDCSWTEFRPRPQSLSITENCRRLFYNAKWNESLFLVSCAERILSNSSPQQVRHSENEILERISNALHQTENTNHAQYLQFRLLYISREQNKLVEVVAYQSRKYAFSSPSSGGEI